MPSGTPAALAVMERVVTVIGAITSGVDYDTDVALSKLGDESILDQEIFPCAIVSPFENSHSDDVTNPTDSIESSLTVNVIVALSTYTDGVQKVAKFVRDVWQSLLADHQLGGVCRDWRMSSESYWVVQRDTNAIHGADIRFRVIYRTDRGNLNEAI